MAAENVYFLELLYSIAVDKYYQFLQQMTILKKAPWRILCAWECGNRWVSNNLGGLYCLYASV